jgi:hypothetical protein
MTAVEYVALAVALAGAVGIGAYAEFRRRRRERARDEADRGHGNDEYRYVYTRRYMARLAYWTSRDQARLMWAVWGWSVYVLVFISRVELRRASEGWQVHGSLGPAEVPDLITGVAAITTAAGVFVGGVLKGIAALMKARGDAQANTIRAQAEFHYAEADMRRAEQGLPPTPRFPGLDPPAGSGAE